MHFMYVFSRRQVWCDGSHMGQNHRSLKIKAALMFSSGNAVIKPHSQSLCDMEMGHYFTFNHHLNHIVQAARWCVAPGSRHRGNVTCGNVASNHFLPRSRITRPVSPSCHSAVITLIKPIWLQQFFPKRKKEGLGLFLRCTASWKRS